MHLSTVQVPSSDNLCKQSGPISGLTKRLTLSGSKLFDTSGTPEIILGKEYKTLEA